MVGMRPAGRSVRLLGIVGAIAVTLIAALTAMLTVTAVAITPQRHLEQLLPANTIMFLTVDSVPNQLPNGLAILSKTAAGVFLRHQLPTHDGRTKRCLGQASDDMTKLPRIGAGTAIARYRSARRPVERSPTMLRQSVYSRRS